MADEVKNVEQLDVTTNGDVSTDEVAKTDKTFSQAELDRLVANRVRREKDAASKLKEEYEAQLSEKDSLVESYETILKKVIAEKAKDLPENYRKLLDKLSVVDQLDFLSSDENKVSKKTIPVTPKTTETVQPTGTAQRRKFM